MLLEHIQHIQAERNYRLLASLTGIGAPRARTLPLPAAIPATAPLATPESVGLPGPPVPPEA